MNGTSSINSPNGPAESDRTPPLWLRLLVAGRNAARHSESARTRFVSLALSSLVVALSLAAMAFVHAAYAGKESRQQDRTPVLQADVPGGGPATLWLLGSDSLTDERRFSVVSVAPQSANAPPPPGVRHWPRPGEAVLSPGLLKAGADEGIESRYGRLAGTIGQEGLSDPGEWLAYVHPSDGMEAKRPAEPVAGFGPRAGVLAEGLEPGYARDQDQPEWMLQSLVVGFLLLPGLVLLFISARAGAHARDRRGSLIDALGGRRRDRAMIATGEAVRPVVLGAVLALLPVGALMLRDTTVPYVGYRLSATDLLQRGWPALLAPLVATVLALALAIGTDQLSGRARGTRPSRPPGTRRQRRIAMLCPFAILLAARGPEAIGDNTQYRTYLVGIGLAAVVLTLPSAVAVVTAEFGGFLERTARRRGWAGTLVAGRRFRVYPAATARLVTGVLVALLVFAQTIAWQGLFGSYHAELQRTLDVTETSVAEIGPKGTVSAADMAAFLKRVPRGSAPVVITSPAAEKSGPITVAAGCSALKTLDLPCAQPRARFEEVGDARLQQLVRWNTEGGTHLTATRAAPAELARNSARTDGRSTLAIVNHDGSAPSFAALKRISYETLPRGAQVRFPGEEWLANSVPDRDQGRWARLFGVVGVGLLVLAAGLSGRAEFVRHGRALAPLAALTGTHRVFRTSAAWAVIAPLVAAGVVGGVAASWMVQSVARPGTTYSMPLDLMAGAVALVCVISGVMWLWAQSVSKDLARHWRA